MNDDLYLIVIGVGLVIAVLGTLFGMHRVGKQGRLMRERIARIGACPNCRHAEHPSFCMVVVGPRLTCGCDLMTDPEVLSA